MCKPLSRIRWRWPSRGRRKRSSAFFYGRDNDPLRHFIYYVERDIELDGDSHGPMGRELLEGLVADSPQRDERALRAACNSIKARIELWNGTLSTLRDKRAA
jgi:hypothetical protein